MDPIQGLCSRRWKFTLKRRIAWHSVVVADKKASLLRRVSLADLTGCGKAIGHSRQSTAGQQGNAAGGRFQYAADHVVPAVNPTVSASNSVALWLRLRDRPNRRLQPKSMRCCVSKEEASGDAAVR